MNSFEQVISGQWSRKPIVVISGGGTAGLTFGAVLDLVRRCQMEQKNRRFTGAGGISIGSAIAFYALMCSAHSKDYLETILTRYPYSTIFQRDVRPGYQSLAQGLSLRFIVTQMLREHGFSSTTTFASFYEATELDFRVGATDLVTGRLIVCSYQITPDMPLLEAMVASASLPGIFPVVSWKTHALVDGGVLDPAGYLLFPERRLDTLFVTKCNVMNQTLKNPSTWSMLDVFSSVLRVTQQQLQSRRPHSLFQTIWVWNDSTGLNLFSDKAYAYGLAKEAAQNSFQCSKLLVIILMVMGWAAASRGIVPKPRGDTSCLDCPWT